jgi:hypothetical protein
LSKKIIQDKRLKYGTLSNMNDACENSKCIYNDYSSQNDEFICDDIKAEIYKYRQLSLSEDKKGSGRRGFDLQQMWGLYADGGFGACLVFDKDELLKSLPETAICNSVSYVPEITSDTFTCIRNGNEIEADVKECAPMLLFTKRKEWEHEQEFRIVNKFKNTEGDEFLDVTDSLKYIILNNAKSVELQSSNDRGSILKSPEYNEIRQILPKGVKILVYASFAGEQSLIYYDENEQETYWNCSEKLPTEIVTIDINPLTHSINQTRPIKTNLYDN